MHIRSHLSLMVAAVLVPVLLAGAVAVENVRQGKRQAALDGLNETVRATSLVIDRDIQSSISALQALGNSDNLRTGDMRAFYEQAKALDKPPHVWTLLFDEAGTQLVNTSVPFETLPRASSAGAQERIGETLKNRQPVVSSLLVGLVSGRLLTTIYVPALAGAPKKYVVAQGFAVDHWKYAALDPKGREGWVVAVIDNNGKFVARSHRSDALLGKNARPELVAAAAASASGVLRHATLENVEVYDAFAHSPLTGWTIAVAAPVDAIESSVWESIRWLMIGVAGSLAAATLLALYFGRGLARSIQEASNAARALGRGELPAQGDTSIHELQLLNQDLMNAGALLARERDSRQLAEAERERLLANEVAAKLTAQAQNKAKDQFLGMLGHELRTPLAAISSAAEVLRLSGGDDQKRARFLDVIRRQDAHLLHIVDDLLDVNRLLAGKIQLSKEPIDLVACVDRCVSDLRLTSAAAGYVIQMIADGDAWIAGDPVRIHQIVINLVTNALKYSPEGSRIDVEVRSTDSTAILRVTDNGMGMAGELLARIFEPFVQGPGLPNRVSNGLGIGLALVRQLVELHGGTVQAHSAGLQQGSTVTLSFPRMEGRRPPLETIATQQPTKMASLLLVEDNDDARIALAEFLRVLGHEVTEASDGRQGMNACVAWVPDAIITDIGLPDISGYELAAHFRRHPLTRHTPLIALTGYGQESDKDRAIAAGFDAHLVKPVDADRLVATLESVLAPQHDN